MSNAFQSYQGFGISPEQMDPQRKAQMELAASLAALPNTELGYEWLGSDVPKGQMVSGHFVAPSMTQYLASAAKQGLGGLMVKRRGDQAAALAKAFAERTAKPTNPGVTPIPNPEVDSLYGQ